MHNERLYELAKAELLFRHSDGVIDYRLWEHTERVVALTHKLAGQRKLPANSYDADALLAAALFHVAGWAEQLRAAQISRLQLLVKPTNDVQRELGATILQEKASAIVPARSLRLAADAIRQAPLRSSDLVEAQLLNDADTLAEFGVLDIVRQLRAQQADGRPLEQVIETWKRQREYDYWDSRIRTGLRHDSARRIAEARLKAVDAMMTALQSEAGGTDAGGT